MEEFRYNFIIAVTQLTPTEQTRDEDIVTSVGPSSDVNLQPQYVEQCFSEHPEHIDDAEVVEETS